LILINTYRRDTERKIKMKRIELTIALYGSAFLLYKLFTSIPLLEAFAVLLIVVFGLFVCSLIIIEGEIK